LLHLVGLTRHFIPLEIKKFLAEKRKARTKWQRSSTPSDKTIFNRLSSILKSQLQVLRTNSFKNYVSTLSRYSNSIWKPINSSRKPVLTSPPLRLESPSPERWVKKRQRKSSCIREIPRGRIPTARTGTRRRNA